MHFRLQFWMALFALVAVSAVRAQTPAPAPVNAPAASAMPPGQIQAVKVVGSVSYVVNGQTTALHDGDPVPAGATVNTLAKSSVILVFSNGATTQLGDETTLVIAEFLQDPFAQQIAVASLTEEPTVSHTHLDLKHGELIGNVKHLKKEQGSTFTIDTPVGAAGIRGTTFRIIFKPSGQGLAFAIFSVSTVEGNVVFQSAQAQQQQQQQQQQSQQANETRARGGSVAVTTGQEVVVTVSVETDPKTGQVVVTAPIQLATTTPLNPVVRASIVADATTMAKTVEEKATSFTPTTTSGGTSSGSNSSSSTTTSTDTTKKEDDKPADKSASDTSGGTSSGGDTTGGMTTGGSTTGGTTTGGSTTGGTTTGGSSTQATSTTSTSTSEGKSSGSTSTGAASTLTSSIAGGRQLNTKPGFTSSNNDLTPGAGS